MKPNALAWAALYGWPIVVLAFFGQRRGTARLARTTAWMLILPVMFLPAMIELPAAGLDKHRISFLSLALALLVFHPRELAAPGRMRRFPLLVLAVLTAGAIGTLRTNGDPLTFGPLHLPALALRDAISTVYGLVVDVYLPFAIGQRVFKTERDARDLLEVLAACGLAYVPLCLLEMRLSPQLSSWIYGYFPHQFAQTRRGSGFRAVVFMNHGLSVATFLFSSFCASAALYRARASDRRPARAGVIGLTLLLGRSMASILYALSAGVLVLFTSTRSLARAALVVALVVAAYPAARALDVVPTHAVSDFFGRIGSEERRDSLQFRFDNEDMLLQRALKRPAFGWGGWGRSRIFVWWGTGWKDISITDGEWVIRLGTGGVVGLVGFFALMLVPILRFASNRSLLPPSAQTLVGALAIVVALFAADLLPNARSDYLPMVYAGALFSLSRRARRRSALPAPETGAPMPGQRPQAA